MRTTLTERQRVSDNSDERRYFTMVPHLVTDSALSPAAFRLYVHYRRRCGEFGGTVEESIRKTAATLHLSVGATFRARAELQEAGFITLHLEGPVGHETAQIGIVNIWRRNIEAYDPPEDWRSNNERKPKRAAPEAVAFQCGTPTASQPDASVRDCVPHWNAARPYIEKLEEPEKNLLEDAAATAAAEGQTTTSKNGTAPRSALGLAAPREAPSDPPTPLVPPDLADAGEAWAGARKLLQEALRQDHFATYLAELRALGVSADGVLYLQPPTPLHLHWLEHKFRPAIAQAVLRAGQPDWRVEFITTNGSHA